MTLLNLSKIVIILLMPMVILKYQFKNDAANGDFYVCDCLNCTLVLCVFKLCQSSKGDCIIFTLCLYVCHCT